MPNSKIQAIMYMKSVNYKISCQTPAKSNHQMLVIKHVETPKFLFILTEPVIKRQVHCFRYQVLSES